MSVIKSLILKWDVYHLEKVTPTPLEKIASAI